MKRSFLYRTTVIRGESLRSIARALGFSPARLAVRLTAHPNRF
ncbi:hypothetical protein [Piscirickettsia salmonis]|nr:hypothetical protein [Piscirickettsia salmonis]